MFTGIVEEIGRVVRATGARIAVRGPLVTADAKLGDSIAVAGVCLTVVELHDGVFAADIMAQTRRHTALGDLQPGAPVNLERALRADGRLGGHIVQGHVDGVGELATRESGSHFDTFRFTLNAELNRYLAKKGSVAVDGTSLTVADVDETGFAVGLIPATLRHTTLGGLIPGRRVNIEVDILAKYMERLLDVGECAR
jgi:riboflavin synthase